MKSSPISAPPTTGVIASPLKALSAFWSNRLSHYRARTELNYMRSLDPHLLEDIGREPPVSAFGHNRPVSYLNPAVLAASMLPQLGGRK